MAKIKILEKVVADQIAAGEVVERPASVVKELVENSIDAGATNITLELDGGGVGRIRVMDNGGGFENDDLENAFLRHATSKIESIEDLNEVISFGFRGEALASIASVAKVIVHTRIKDAVAGTKLVIEGGQIVQKREAPSPVGTDFEVRDLFYNVPARLKFLKKEATELSHCIEALVRLALIRPSVSFKVISKGRVVRELVKVESPIERVKMLFSNETLAMSEGEENGVSVAAILGAPERARAGAGSLYTYVNGRYIRDRALFRAVTQGFAGTLANGRYPVGFIAIDVPPSSFDVNVHPQKTEVRFANPQVVFRAVTHTVGQMAGQAPWSRYGSVSETEAVEPSPSVNVAASIVRDSAVSYEHSSKLPAPPSTLFGADVKPKKEDGEKSAPLVSTEQAFKERAVSLPQPSSPIAFKEHLAPVNNLITSDTEPFSSLNYIGQAQNLFLLCEDESDLVIIDQHAAHERVKYERLRKQLETGHITSQRLLSPHMIDLGPTETNRIVELKADLAKLGLDVEQAGADRIAIYSVPAEIDASPDRLLAEMVIALEEGREGTKGEMEDKAVATIACHSSIRKGKALHKEEVASLLSQMDAIDFAGHCPHGRPVLARIPWTEIRKRVKRE